ncbi:MAG: hypothetical protein V3U92_19670 [Cellulophaga sp.]
MKSMLKASTRTKKGKLFLILGILIGVVFTQYLSNKVVLGKYATEITVGGLNLLQGDVRTFNKSDVCFYELSRGNACTINAVKLGKETLDCLNEDTTEPCWQTSENLYVKTGENQVFTAYYNFD